MVPVFTGASPAKMLWSRARSMAKLKKDRQQYNLCILGKKQREKQGMQKYAMDLIHLCHHCHTVISLNTNINLNCLAAVIP
jgi:hypothetical protein